MEETFNKNIYVFSLTNMHPILDAEIISDPVLEIPRYKLFHARVNRRNRETIIILKQMIGKSAFQCALIRSKGNRLVIKNRGEELFTDRNRGDDELKIDNSKTSNMDVFPKEMGDHLYKILSSLSTNIEIRQDVDDKESPFSIRRNIFSKCNWDEIFNGYSIIGQRVDEYGKMKILSLKKINETSPLIYVYIPSGQPLNVPRIDKIYAIPDELAVQLFGPPSGINKYGLWFRILDFSDGIFVPTTRTNDYKDVLTIPPPLGIINFSDISSNPIDNVSRARKEAEIFIKLVIWCWRHTLIRKESSMSQELIPSISSSTSAIEEKRLSYSRYEDIDSWWAKYVVINESTKDDTSMSYLQDRIRYFHQLPQVESCSDAIKSLSDRKFGWPEYFNDGSNTNDGLPKIMMYRNLYDKMKLYMKRIYTVNEGLSIPPENGISDIFTDESDFISHPKQLILSNNEKLVKWEDYYRREAEDTFIMYNNINMNFMFNSEPYICSYIEMNKPNPLTYIFLIQNTRNKNINSALYLCTTWNDKKYNIGSGVSVPADFSDDLSYIVFGITKSQRISPIRIRNAENSSEENKFDPDVDYLYVLEYTKNDYAAMLPLSFFRKSEEVVAVPISIPLNFKITIPSIKPAVSEIKAERPSTVSASTTFPSITTRSSTVAAPTTLPSITTRSTTITPSITIPSFTPIKIPSFVTQSSASSTSSSRAPIRPLIPSFVTQSSAAVSSATTSSSRSLAIPSFSLAIPSFVTKPSTRAPLPGRIPIPSFGRTRVPQ